MASAVSSSVMTTTAQSGTFDGIETCSPQFSPLCFACGRVPSPIPGDPDPKTIVVDPNGMDVIFRLVRNSVNVDMDDLV